MAELVCLVMFLQLIIFAESSHTITPTSFNFTTLLVEAANGSSAVGGCSSVTLNLDSTSTCNNPSSSVLFDRRTPTLAALDGDTWARQLMILYTPDYYFYNFNSQTSHSIDISYATSTGRRRVEVTIFNCPQWGTGVRYIRVYQFTTSYRQIGIVYPTVISCTSLLRVCIPFDTTTTSSRFRLRFYSFYRPVEYVHIAEIAFYSSSTPCLPYTTIPGIWTPPPPPPDIDTTTTKQRTGATHTQNSSENSTTSKQPTDVTHTQSSGAPTESKDRHDITTTGLNNRVEGEMSFVIIIVLVAIMTLQTTVIFAVLIIIACRRKSTGSASRRETNTHETVEMKDHYETVNAGGNTLGCSGRRNATMQFKINEAYAIPKEIVS